MKKSLVLSVSLISAMTPFMVVGVETEKTEAEAGVDAKSLFEGRCQMCHQLPDPDMLKPAQWRLILVTMQQRMEQAGVPPLTKDETDLILEYIAEQAH